MRVSILGLIAFSVCAGCSPQERQRGGEPDLPFPVDRPVPAETPAAECVPGSEPAEGYLFPERLELSPGSSGLIEVSVTRNGYCGPIEVTVGTLPSEVHAEVSPAIWPDSVAEVRLTAGDTVDDVRKVPVYVWMGWDGVGEVKLRTRAEPDWGDSLVGIPGSHWIEGLVRTSPSRILVADRRYAVDHGTNVVVCIEIDVGPCMDFGTLGIVELEGGISGAAQGADMALAPDGTVVVASSMTEAGMRSTTLHRVTPSGEVTLLESSSPVTSGFRTTALEVDALGRILWLPATSGTGVPSTLYRFRETGDLDESFGSGGRVQLSNGATRVRSLSDGRIVLTGAFRVLVLEENGAQAAPPLDPGVSGGVKEIYPDGSVIIGSFKGPDFHEEGSVTLLNPDGTVAKTWDLGYQIRPLAFAIDGDAPIISARVEDSGVVRVFRLEEAPVVIAEREIGSSVYGLPKVRANNDGPLVIMGTRSVRLGSSNLPWTEGFLWRPE